MTFFGDAVIASHATQNIISWNELLIIAASGLQSRYSVSRIQQMFDPETSEFRKLYETVILGQRPVSDHMVFAVFCLGG